MTCHIHIQMELYYQTYIILHVPLAFLSAFDQGIFTSMRCGNFLDSAKVRKLTLSKKKIITYCHLKHYENSSWEDKGYMLNLLPIKKKTTPTHNYIDTCMPYLYASHPK